MSETAAKFDMCTICRHILKLNGPVHLDPAGIILDGELESIGPFNFPVPPSVPRRKESPVVFRPTTPTPDPTMQTESCCSLGLGGESSDLSKSDESWQLQ